MGPARLSQPDLLPRGRQGRPLRGVGAAGALLRRAPRRVQITSAMHTDPWSSTGTSKLRLTWSMLDTMLERNRRTLHKRSARHEARGRRHPCFGRRSRQALLRRPGLAARRRLRRRRRVSGHPVHASGSPCSIHFGTGSHAGRAGLGTADFFSSSRTSRPRAPSSSVAASR